uniref:Uncharacterized protein n=1 Tax=Anopheles dirus TaxID=7168 RepID=A0A182NK67_9DIPT
MTFTYPRAVRDKSFCDGTGSGIGLGLPRHDGLLVVCESGSVSVCRTFPWSLPDETDTV